MIVKMPAAILGPVYSGEEGNTDLLLLPLSDYAQNLPFGPVGLAELVPWKLSLLCALRGAVLEDRCQGP